MVYCRPAQHSRRPCPLDKRDINGRNARVPGRWSASKRVITDAMPDMMVYLGEVEGALNSFRLDPQTRLSFSNSAVLQCRLPIVYCRPAQHSRQPCPVGQLGHVHGRVARVPGRLCASKSARIDANARYDGLCGFWWRLCLDTPIFMSFSTSVVLRCRRRRWRAWRMLRR